MKKRNYLMLALAVTAFAACSENVILDEPENGGVIDPKGDAWVALSVQTTSKTRGLNSPDKDTGTPDESKIASVKAIFFDGHTDASEVTKVVDFVAGDDFIDNQPNRSDAFKVPASSQSVLIVANPVNLPTITTKTESTAGTTYKTVNAAISNITDVTAGVAKSESFLMTNAKGGLEPSKSDGSPERLTLYSTAALAESAPLTIRLDRVAAKARVILDNTGNDLSTSATISDVNWFLNVTNKKYFPVSVRTETMLNTLTPFDQYGLGSYRIDPNYGDALNPIGEAADYDDNYNYVSSSTDPNNIDWSELGTSYPVYCLENTQIAEYNVHAYTTQVLLKARYAPKTLKVYGSDTPVDLQDGEDWFIMNNGFYTNATILTYIEEELKNKYMHNDPAAYNTPITDGYNDYIAKLGINKVDISQATQLDQTDAELKASAVVHEFGLLAGQISTASAGGKNLGEVSYYSEGICYYKIMVKHDNKDANDFMNQLGEFGVVRNSVYDIHISGINNPGYPSIPDPDPNTPDEDLERFLSIKIEVNPWTWYTQTVEL